MKICYPLVTHCSDVRCKKHEGAHMATAKKSSKSKATKSRVRVRDLKPAKNPKGGRSGDKIMGWDQIGNKKY